ncbi:PREDICTED: anaphase-promoting complex subunit 11 [Myotis davidii]|uniref:anaphase-promoting complex subunit 11 n=1 Tax=Myotis davidii TaxID=225400 RepID=UPI0007674098|nr:PREDICTED: anaphase-promoting complex subunit 11 [Myotis davidii]
MLVDPWSGHTHDATGECRNKWNSKWMLLSLLFCSRGSREWWADWRPAGWPSVFCQVCKVPGDDCPLVWGQCSHCFHMHCILKWLNAQQVQQHCPMCRQEWKFKE